MTLTRLLLRTATFAFVSVSLTGFAQSASTTTKQPDYEAIAREEAILVQAFKTWELALTSNRPALPATLRYVETVTTLTETQVPRLGSLYVAARRFRVIAPPEDVAELLKSVKSNDLLAMHGGLTDEDRAVLREVYLNRNDPLRRGQHKGRWLLPVRGRSAPAQPAVIDVAEVLRRAALRNLSAYYDLGQIYLQGLGVPSDNVAGNFWLGEAEKELQIGPAPVDATPQEQIAYYKRFRSGGTQASGPPRGSEYARWKVISLGLENTSDPSQISLLVEELRHMAKDGHPAAMRLLIRCIRNRQYGLSDLAEAGRLEHALAEKEKSAL